MMVQIYAKIKFWKMEIENFIDVSSNDIFLSLVRFARGIHF